MEPTSIDGSDLRSDADLIVASRAGDAGAFGMLYERHAGAALVVARQYTRGTAEAEDVVADAFTAVWSAFQGGSGPTDAFRAYLYTVVRRVAAAQRSKGQRVEPTDDVAVLEAGSMAEPAAEEPAFAGFERSVVARAFASLPERWQAVLWHSEVEGLTPAQIAPLLGLSANSTAALAYRAREGLRQAYLQQHLADPLDEACRAVAGKLGGYVRGGLGARDTAQVEGHLEECGSCRALVLELRDVNRGLRGIVAPLVLGAAGLGALKFTLPTSGGTAAGAASLSAGGAAAGGGAGAAGGAAGATGAGATSGAGAAGGATAGASAGAGAAGAAGTGAAAGAGAVGAVGAGVAGVVGAAGVSGAAAAGAGAVGAAAGATASGGFFAAIGAALAGIPTALVAGIAGVVVVAGATVGIVQATGGHDEPPAAGATSESQPGTTAPAAGTTASPTPGPSALPSPSPAEDGGQAPADEAATGDTGSAGTSGSSDASGGTAALSGTGSGSSSGSAAGSDGSGAAASPSPAPGASPTPDSSPTPGSSTTADPSSGPSSSPTADPSPTGSSPTVDPSPSPSSSATATPTTPGAPYLVVTQPDSEPELTVGETGELSVDVTNDGSGPATDLTADVALPAGVTAEDLVGSLSGRSAVHVAAGTAWACSPADGGVRCTLPVLDAGETTTLTVRVKVDDDFAGDAGDVGWHVYGPGFDCRSVPTTVKVNPVAARLWFADDPSDLTLPLARPTAERLTVKNFGGVAATPATVTLAAPEGVTVEGGGGGWTCAPVDGGLRCTLPTLAPGATSTLPLTLTAGGAAVDGGTLGVTFVPSGKGLVSRGVPVTVVTPVLGLDLSATAEGLVTATVDVDDADAEDVALAVTVPGGLAFDEADGRWPDGCTVAGDTATCDLGDVDQGEPVTLVLPADVEAAIADSVTATVTATGATPVRATAPVGTSSGGLSVRYQGQGSLDVTEVGAPVLGCDPELSGALYCNAVRQTGTADNNTVRMASLGATSATLTVPAGSRVVFAGLYWSANKWRDDAWSAAATTASLRGPSGGVLPVTAESTSWVTDDAGRSYYQSFADVTAQVAALGGGSWTVGGIAVGAGAKDPVPTYYGGWALVVVYDDPAVSPAAVTVYDGAAWVGTGTRPEFRFTTTPGATVRIGTVGWEGDRTNTGDQLLLDGVALTPSRTGGSPSNAFDSTATGWAYANSLGVDAKGFRPATTTGRVGVLRATSSGDQYLLGAVTVRVPRSG